MKIKKLKEYKLKDKRRISPRNQIIIGDNLYSAFIFDKGDTSNSRIICLDICTFEEKWTYDYDFIINKIMKSPISNNIVSVCMDGRVEEIDLLEGQLIKEIDLNVNRCGFPSVIVDNKIVTGGIQGSTQTTCIDLKDFKIEWEFDTDGHSYTPLISAGQVYQCTEHYLRCLDLNTGSLIWKVKEASTYLLKAEKFKDLILASGHGLINFYHKHNGRLIKQLRTQTDALNSAIRYITTNEENIYFSDHSGGIYAYECIYLDQYNIETKLLWVFKSDGEIESQLKLYKDYLVFANSNKNLFIINRHTGEECSAVRLKESAEICDILLGEDGSIIIAYEKGYISKFLVGW